jgi:glutamate-1-semialdehyde aminotransferase
MKIKEVTSLEILNIYGTMRALIENDHQTSLYEAKFIYGGENTKMIDLNGQEFIDFVENMKLNWICIEN